MKQYLQHKIIILGIALSFCSFIAMAQAPMVQWDKTFGGAGSDQLYSLCQTADGGYILGGTSSSGISGNKSGASKGSTDYWVVKLRADGSKHWDKTFGSSGEDELSYLVQNLDGSYLLGGTSNSGVSGDKTAPSKGGEDYWLVKINATGNKVWDKTIGGSGNDLLNSLIKTTDGGYLLGGLSNSGISGNKSEGSNGNYDFWIVKIDSMGVKQWDKTYGGNGMDHLNSLIQTTDGGYMAAGNSSSGISGNKTTAPFGREDYWVLKLNNSGQKLWENTFGGSETDILNCIAQTIDGGYILGGGSESGISGNKTETNASSDYWVVKTDSNGIIEWDKTIGGNGYDFLGNIIQSPDSSYVLCGMSDSGISGQKTEPSKGGSDYWVITLKPNRTVRWEKTLGARNSDVPNSFQLAADGGIIVGGQSFSGISGDKSETSFGSSDYWIVKLDPAGTTGINESTSNFNLSISPNPSQGKFQLQLNNLTAKPTAITVSDLVGRIIYQQEIPVTGNQIHQEINLPAIKGMYLLHVKAGEQTTACKIVID